MKKFFFSVLGLVALIWFLRVSYSDPTESFTFKSPIWRGGEISVEGTQILKKDKLVVDLSLKIEDKLLEEHTSDDDEIGVLLVLERLFDAEGRAHTINNEYYSTVITPGGKPVEFSESKWGAPSKYNQKEDGLYFTTPVDRLMYYKVGDMRDVKTGKFETAYFYFEEDLNEDVQGMFRPRVYFFYNKVGTQQEHRADPYNSLLLSHQLLFPVQEKFVEKPDPWGNAEGYSASNDKLFYLPIFKRYLKETPKLPAVLFAAENSQGSRGIEADEDLEHFRISTHEINQSKLVLPPETYDLNPALPLVTAFDAELNLKNERIPLVAGGYVQATIRLPNGKVRTLKKKKISGFGVADEGPFQTGQAIAWRTVKTTEENTYKFQEAGLHEVVLKGEVVDEFGNTYTIGGTYPFYIGKKLTFSSAVKPGTPFFVGDAYFPRFAYHPAFQGEVSFHYKFFPFDHTKEPTELILESNEAKGGFGGAPILFEEPGEYYVEVVAHAKHFMMGDMYGTYVGGALVVPRESDVTLHGKRGVNFSDGTQIETERFVSERSQMFEVRREYFLPYHSGDVLKVAAHAKNVINPLVEVTDAEGNEISVISRAEGNLHPFNYPEKVKQNAYLFITSEKAGLIARSFVGSEYLNHGFWNVTNQSFGGRLNSSKYGDLPNDAYRNFATVYFEDEAGNVQTDSHVSNIVVLPEDAPNDRVVAPFAEEFIKNFGKSKKFVIGTGLQKSLGANFSQYVHLFPAVGGVSLDLSIFDPVGKRYDLPTLQTDEHGFTPVGEMIAMDIPGVWTVYARVKYGKYSDNDFYKIFVVGDETERLDLGIPPMAKLTAEDGFVFKSDFPEGARNVRVEYEVITPGAFLDTNEVGICAFKQNYEGFEYHLDFKKLNEVYGNIELEPLSRMLIAYFHVSGEINGEVFRQFGVGMIRGENLYDMGIPPVN